jgi:DNA-binding protein HU-beta
MNKAQLIEVIRKQLGESATKKQAEEALTAVIEGIKAGIEQAGKVQLIGFGTFAVKERAERTGRNPQTGATITIPASKSVSFKASPTLKA